MFIHKYKQPAMERGRKGEGIAQKPQTNEK
jgi:hypothetical protein